MQCVKVGQSKFDVSSILIKSHPYGYVNAVYLFFWDVFLIHPWYIPAKSSLISGLDLFEEKLYRLNHDSRAYRYLDSDWVQ